jgi:hypothetical protein
MGIKSPIHIKILNDTLDIVTLMTLQQKIAVKLCII